MGANLLLYLFLLSTPSVERLICFFLKSGWESSLFSCLSEGLSSSLLVFSLLHLPICSTPSSVVDWLICSAVERLCGWFFDFFLLWVRKLSKKFPIEGEGFVPLYFHSCSSHFTALALIYFTPALLISHFMVGEDDFLTFFRFSEKTVEKFSHRR